MAPVIAQAEFLYAMTCLTPEGGYDWLKQHPDRARAHTGAWVLHILFCMGHGGVQSGKRASFLAACKEMGVWVTGDQVHFTFEGVFRG